MKNHSFMPWVLCVYTRWHIFSGASKNPSHHQGHCYQQVTWLTLLDLSAAFDATDHTILFDHLSFWFGITSTALFWVESYLLNRSFYVTIDSSVSSVTNFSLVCLKVPYLVFSYSSCTLLLSPLSFLTQPQIITSKQNCRWHSTFLIFFGFFLFS